MCSLHNVILHATMPVKACAAHEKIHRSLFSRLKGFNAVVYLHCYVVVSLRKFLQRCRHFISTFSTNFPFLTCCVAVRSIFNFHNRVSRQKNPNHPWAPRIDGAAGELEARRHGIACVPAAVYLVGHRCRCYACSGYYNSCVGGHSIRVHGRLALQHRWPDGCAVRPAFRVFRAIWPRHSTVARNYGWFDISAGVFLALGTLLCIYSGRSHARVHARCGLHHISQSA